MRNAKYQHRLLAVIYLLLTIIILMLFFGCVIGDSIYTVHVLNQTNQSVTVSVTVHPAGHTTRIGKVDPGKEIEYKEIYFETYSYQVKNDQGEVVYSKEFTFDEMKEMDWKVVIPDSFD